MVYRQNWWRGHRCRKCSGEAEIVAGVTKREGDLVGTGRFLLRALVVVGGAAAVSTVAWMSATASASAGTQIAAEPIGSGSPAAVTTAGHQQPQTRSLVADVVPAVSRDLHHTVTAPAAVHNTVDALGASVHAIAATHIPAVNVAQVADSVITTFNVGRSVAATATNLVDLTLASGRGSRPAGDAPVDPTRVVERDSVVPVAAISGMPMRMPASASSGVPVRAITADAPVSIRAHELPASGHEDGGYPVRPWSPSCVVSASMCLAVSHDRGTGVAAPQGAADYQLLPRGGYGVRDRCVTATEIRPGVTPD